MYGPSLDFPLTPRAETKVSGVKSKFLIKYKKIKGTSSRNDFPYAKGENITSSSEAIHVGLFAYYKRDK